MSVTADAAERWGIPALAGPCALAALAYGIAGPLLFLLLRPDPLQVSRTLPAAADSDGPGRPGIAAARSIARYTVLRACLRVSDMDGVAA